MIIENADAYKNIKSLLPSVQNKIAHNAIIKLLLDQGKDLTQKTSSVFEPVANDWEKLFRLKQIPCDTIYQTQNNRTAPAYTLRFTLSNQDIIGLSFDRSFGRFILDSLLDSDANSTASFSSLEQRVLENFFKPLIQKLNLGFAIDKTAFGAPLDKRTLAATFVVKTKHASYSFDLHLPNATTDEIAEPFYDKLLAHVTQLELPIAGTLEQSMPLSKFVELKKGDLISFARPVTTQIKTQNHTLVTGKLNASHKHLQIKTGES